MVDRAAGEPRPALLDAQVVAGDVDLRRVEFFGSSGLAALVKHRERCLQLGGGLCVVADHRGVLRPLKITGLDRVVPVVATVEEAVRDAGDAVRPSSA